ncbi:MAG TPA: alpha/beta hydrolase [Rhodothermales bacterium]|nr:alpha/beta hydrolase [Rhodothermales bacterium]
MIHGLPSYMTYSQRFLVSICLVLLCWATFGNPEVIAQGSAVPDSVLLWPEGAPMAVGDTPTDRPLLYLYPAPEETANGTAVVVFPGGGYVHLAMDHEGRQIARWLNGMGISAFVLRYRLGDRYDHPVPLLDAQRAVRWVRYQARRNGVDPRRIGIWGFSAGGHLASTAATHFDGGDPAAQDPIDRVSSRPDFLILAYPVVTFEEPYAHVGSRNYLIGEHPDPKLIEELSNEKHVTAQTPPTFIFHTDDDPVVPVENSILFYMALKKAGVPAEMHIYAHGPHGVGLAPTDPVLSSWGDRLRDWLQVMGLRPPVDGSVRSTY